MTERVSEASDGGRGGVRATAGPLREPAARKPITPNAAAGEAAGPQNASAMESFDSPPRALVHGSPAVPHLDLPYEHDLIEGGRIDEVEVPGPE